MAEPGETYLMTSAELRDLFRVDRRTLHDWRASGKLQAVRLTDTGHWRYPAAQPLVQRALAAVRRPR